MQFSPPSARPPRLHGTDTVAPPARAAAIAEQHLDVIWRMARRLGVPPGEIEDMAQEVFVVVVRRLEQIQVGKERAFVASATVRVASNWRRSRRRRPEEPSDAIEVLASSLRPDALAGVDAEQNLDRSRKLAMLEQALEAMTEPQREAFVLFDLEQLTAPEIAEQLGLPEAAIVSRVRRARQVLGRAMTTEPKRLAKLASASDGKQSR